MAVEIKKERKNLFDLLTQYGGLASRGAGPSYNFMRLVDKLNSEGDINGLKYKEDVIKLLSDKSQTFTVLVPDNEALDPFLRKKTLPDSKTLFDVLQNHILVGKYCIGDLKPKNGAATVSTLNGKTLCLTAEKTSASKSKNLIINGTIRVSESAKSNFSASNGNIIFIDALITDGVPVCSPKKLKPNQSSQDSKHECVEENIPADFVKSSSQKITENEEPENNNDNMDNSKMMMRSSLKRPMD